MLDAALWILDARFWMLDIEPIEIEIEIGIGAGVEVVKNTMPISIDNMVERLPA